MNTLTLTPWYLVPPSGSRSHRAPSRRPCLSFCAPAWGLKASLSRGYPRLTASIIAKTPLNSQNRAKNFSGGSRASIPCLAHDLAPALDRRSGLSSLILFPYVNVRFSCASATNCPKLRQLAHPCGKKAIAGIARSCREKIIIFSSRSRRREEADRILRASVARSGLTPTNGK